MLLTGDNESAARAIAAQVGISLLRFQCLPEEKLRFIGQSQGEGKPICMIGDGVNDAPALKLADVGLAMGGIGSDIAVDAADIALVNDDIRELPHLLAPLRRMMRTIRINLVLSMALKLRGHRPGHHGRAEPGRPARWCTTRGRCWSSCTPRSCCGGAGPRDENPVLRSRQKGCILCKAARSRPAPAQEAPGTASDAEGSPSNRVPDAPYAQEGMRIQ